jgi:hypothetical protein
VNPFTIAAAALGALVGWHEWAVPWLVERRRQKRAQEILNSMFREHMRPRPYEGVVGLARMRELEELVDELTRDPRKRR